MSFQQLMDFFRRNAFLFKDQILFMPNCLMHESLVRETHGGGLFEHFGITKTLEVLHEHFYWLNMKRDA